MAKRSKQRYNIGTWFAVPLNSGGWAVGVVTGVTKPRSIVLAYFFGPRREEVPDLADLDGRKAGDALVAWQVYDESLAEGDWPVIGERAEWVPEEWPSPVFVRRSSKRAVWFVHHDPVDIAHEIKAEPAPLDVEGYEEDEIYGEQMAARELDRRLGGRFAWYWGPGPFDNVYGEEIVLELMGRRGVRAVEKALAAADVAAKDALTEEVGATAVAAAKAVVEWLERTECDDEADPWLCGHPLHPPRALVEQAVRVLDAVQCEHSELRQLWALRADWKEGGEAAWFADVHDLRVRLLAGLADLDT